MEKLKRLLTFAKPYSRYWPQYVFFTFFGMILGIFNFALIQPLLDVVFDPSAMTVVNIMPTFSFSVDYVADIFNYYLAGIVQSSGRMGALVFVSIVMVIASFLANLLKYGGQRVMASLRTRVIANLRKALFDKITRLDIGYFHKHQKGNLISVLSNDVNEVQSNVVQSFQIIFREPFLIIGYLGVLFYMSYQLTFISLVALLLSGFFIGKVTRKLRSVANKAQAILGLLLSAIEEGITGARIVKAFNGQKYVRNKFNEVNESQTKLQRNIYYKQELATPISEFLGVTVAMLILLVGGWLIINGSTIFSISSFITYIVFYYQILVPFKNITTAYTGIRRGMASADRIFEVLDAPVAIKKTENPIPVKDFKHSIVFNHVSFTYDEILVLQDINLTISKGKMYALVGHSGAGKTTMADLIPRFYDVASGAILLDGIDIREYHPKELMNLIGIVTQEAILFNDTVYNNIVFGMQNVTDEDVVNAAKIANAHDFIMQMEDGYQTNIGDGGNRLSGGQKQRISIARAVMKNPPILILDEATSALDTESERLVQDALTNLMKNRTSIVIAHRLSTIQHADTIVVLQKGEIIEQGTHAELMAQQGTYKRLCDLQTFS
ncbi:MAG: ABC transporter ATP-binding protein/permease [Prevotellaceae bacterium]|jgi:subfamily B ATP-binding cassette protein MsbA|nr:ABC transporter ATP-binding protein/permease [Prevotellaceae bacterium]